MAYWITEKYFFDSLFLNKSVAHGYNPGDVPVERYGKRAEDILMLKSFLSNNQSPSPTALGTETKDIYTVAIIGDSYTWGMGVRNGQRFPEILEGKLNTIRKSKVISLAKPGNDLFDYYLHFRDIQRMLPRIDYYIFALVDNDIYFNLRDKNEPLFIQLSNRCGKEITYNHNNIDDPILFNEQVIKSYGAELGNTCLFREILKLLPKANAMYLETQFDKKEIYLEKYIQPMIDSGFRVVVPDYSSLMTHDIYKVSKREGHPSALTHKLFAEILFEEMKRKSPF